MPYLNEAELDSGVVQDPDPYYVTPSKPPPEPTRVKGHEDVRYQKHYASQAIQPMDIAFSRMTNEQLEGAFVWNVNKYLWRYREKGGVRDIEAASVYLNWLAELLREPLSFRQHCMAEVVSKLREDWL